LPAVRLRERISFRLAFWLQVLSPVLAQLLSTSQEQLEEERPARAAAAAAFVQRLAPADSASQRAAAQLSGCKQREPEAERRQKLNEQRISFTVPP
jgi:hypothetical protein